MARSGRKMGDESDLTYLAFSTQAKLLVLVDQVQHLVLMPLALVADSHRMWLAIGQGSAAQLPARKSQLGPPVMITSNMLWQTSSGLLFFFVMCLEADSVTYNTYSCTF